jgi:hypothetical protein
MQSVGAVKMPGNLPLPLYGQRGCAAVIAGLGWLAWGAALLQYSGRARQKHSGRRASPRLLQLFHDRDQPPCRSRAHDFLRTAASGAIFDQAKRHFALVIYIIIVGVVYAVLANTL